MGEPVERISAGDSRILAALNRSLPTMPPGIARLLVQAQGAALRLDAARPGAARRSADLATARSALARLGVSLIETHQEDGGATGIFALPGHLSPDVLVLLFVAVSPVGRLTVDYDLTALDGTGRGRRVLLLTSGALRCLAEPPLPEHAAALADLLAAVEPQSEAERRYGAAIVRFR